MAIGAAWKADAFWGSRGPLEKPLLGNNSDPESRAPQQGQRMNAGCIHLQTKGSGATITPQPPLIPATKSSGCPRSPSLHRPQQDPPVSPWVPRGCHSWPGRTSYCVMRPLGSTGSSHFRNIMSSSGVKVRDSEAMPPGTGEGKGMCSDAVRNWAGKRNPLGNPSRRLQQLSPVTKPPRPLRHVAQLRYVPPDGAGGPPGQ